MYFFFFSSYCFDYRDYYAEIISFKDGILGKPIAVQQPTKGHKFIFLLFRLILYGDNDADISIGKCVGFSFINLFENLIL